MSYTKGPWRVEKGNSAVWGACDPNDTSKYGRGYPVADLRTMFGYIPALRSYRETESEANANLISAAPEMLEALESFEGLSKAVLGEAPPESDYVSLFIDCDGISHRVKLSDFRLVLSAISKAKGEVK